MKRRQFVTTAAIVAAMGSVSSTASSATANQQYLELRKYHTLYGAKKGLLNDFLKDAAIPVWNRLGIGPVGVFTPMYGQSSPTVYVLLPHESLESVAEATRKLLEDKEFLSKGDAFLNASLSDPSYVRYESMLLKCFKNMPKLEVPEAVKGKRSRIFEMRTYESHSEIKAKKKIEMFNEGGEIKIFRETGLYPVFFGETIVGPQMPNLTYMLSFENLEMRDAHWDVFRKSPGWKELSGKEEFKDTVSNITDVILRPAGFSQV